MRDAVQQLRPVKGDRLGELYDKIMTDEEKQEALAQRVRSVLSGDKEQVHYASGPRGANKIGLAQFVLSLSWFQPDQRYKRAVKFGEFVVSRS